MKEWPQLATCVGHPEWIDGPRFATPEGRTANADVLTRSLEEIFRSRDWHDWRTRFIEAGITFGPIAELEDHVGCPQVAANGLLPEIADMGGLRTVDSPIHLKGEAKKTPRVAPCVGEHSQRILEELGLSASEIERLKTAGAVGMAER